MMYRAVPGLEPHMDRQRSVSWRYGSAVLAVLGTAALRYALADWLESRAAFLPFMPAILYAGLCCGLRPAIVSAVLSFGFGLYFSGLGTIDALRISESLVFVATAGAVVALTVGLARRGEQTAQQSQQAALLAEELSLLIDGARGYAIYMLDPGGHVTIWNTGAERLTGWTDSDVMGRHLSLFYPADAVEEGKPEAMLERAAAYGQLEEEGWRLRKDGSEFLASVTVTALTEPDGRLRGFAKVLRDITDRRASEELLRSRENLLSSVLKTVPDAMVVIDEAGTILSFSAAAQALFGYDEAEVVGRNVSMLMPSPDRERHDGYIERYLRTGEKRIIGIGRIVFGERKDGTTFPMELSIGEAVTGSERMFTGFIRDITERRRTEERLAALQSDLIHVSRVSAMGTMASTIAHELNQPIAAIANYAESVRDMLADPGREEWALMREALDETAKEALRAGHIVRRLRDFVARGEVERSVEPLPALINEASVLGLMGARERGIETKFDLDPYASPVFVDKIQIQQVIINLIRNACEAMAESPVRQLLVRTRPDLPGLVRVTIADTGPGIAPEIAARLFAAFVSSKAEGMGLGLSICRTIVEANGGRIWTEPREGGGTEFHFTLMRADEGDHDDT